MLKRTLLAAGLAAILSGPGLCRADEPQAVTPAPMPDPAVPVPPPTPGMAVLTTADGQSDIEVDRSPLVAQLMQLQAQRQALENQIDQLKAQGRGPDNPEVDNLQRRILDLSAQVAAVSAQNFQNIGYKKATFLGVSVTSASPELRQQLRLQEGFGLVVEEVTPDSPAAAAGVQQYDLLQKLGDQNLVVPVQLEILVRSYKPGDEIKLSVIRGGQPMTLSAKLTEKDLPPLAMIDGNVINNIGELQAVTYQLADPGAPDVAILVDGSGRNLTVNRGGGGGAGGRFVGGFGRPVSGAPGTSASGSFISWTDGQQKLTLNGKHLHATDAQTDAVIFDGDVDSPDMPAATREKLKTLMSLQPASRGVRGGRAFGGGGGGSADGPGATGGSFGGGGRTAGGGGGGPMKVIRTNPGSQILLKTTSRNVLVLTLADGAPAHLLVQDLTGKTLFDGPVATDQDQAKIPAEVRDDFEALRNHPDQGKDLTGK